MNIDYPVSPRYHDLADLWLKTATAENKGPGLEIANKHTLLEATVALTNRIKNLDGSISSEHVSRICRRILKQFNKLSSENQIHIAEYVGTMGETGYEHLHTLFQTIGDTQLLPNYFARQPASSKRLSVALYNSIEIFTELTKIKPLLPASIIDLVSKARECVDLRNSLNKFSCLEEGIVNQIISYLDEPSRIAFNRTCKGRIAKRLDMNDVPLSKFDINSIETLIEYFGSKCKHVKKINTVLFSETFSQPMSKKLLILMQKSFPNLKELFVHGLDANAPKVLKNFKSLKYLHIQDSHTLTDKNFLVDFSFLGELYLSNVNLKRLNAQSSSHLIKLSIVDSPLITTITNVKNLTSLSELLIKNCQEIDLSILGNIPNLRKVAIMFQEKANLSCLANHPHIYDLDISGSKIENFDFLFTMPSLKYLGCVGCNIPKDVIRKLRENAIVVDKWLTYEDLVG